jgi:hypothetical protein
LNQLRADFVSFMSPARLAGSLRETPWAFLHLLPLRCDVASGLFGKLDDERNCLAVGMRNLTSQIAIVLEKGMAINRRRSVRWYYPTRRKKQPPGHIHVQRPDRYDPMFAQRGAVEMAQLQVMKH